MQLMKLDYSQRVAILNVLPPAGDIVMMRLTRDIRAKVELTQEDMTESKLKSKPAPDGNGHTMVWSEEDEIPWEGELTLAEVGCIGDALKVASKKNTLTEAMIDLYGLFVDVQAEETEGTD